MTRGRVKKLPIFRRHSLWTTPNGKVVLCCRWNKISLRLTALGIRYVFRKKHHYFIIFRLFLYLHLWKWIPSWSCLATTKCKVSILLGVLALWEDCRDIPKTFQGVPCNNILIVNLMTRAWNSATDLQTATTLGAAKSVAQKWARNLNCCWSSLSFSQMQMKKKL